MIQLPAKIPIKINRRGLSELVLACAFLSLLTFAIWSWQINGYVEALGHNAAAGATAGEVSLIPLILRNPAIMASTVVSEFVLLLALLLAIVPLSWWFDSEVLISGGKQRVMTPLRWLGEKLHVRRAKQEAPEGEYVMNEAGQLVFVPTPQAIEEEEQEVVMVEQSDGTLLAMVQQADGTLVPADTKPKEESKEGKEGEAQSDEPLIPGPPQPDSALNFEETEEDPLADLADIGDILSTAFDDDNAVDPEREAISRMLQEIETNALLKSARNILATFKQ